MHIESNAELKAVKYGDDALLFTENIPSILTICGGADSNGQVRCVVVLVICIETELDFNS